MTAFGSRTNAIPIGGYGSFDGVMANSFRRPRIEGTFRGERMRAFDVVWGSVNGAVVIEDSYANVKDVVLASERLRRSRPTAGSRSASRAATAARRSTRASA